MLGADGVANLLVERIQSVVPQRLAQIRLRYQVGTDVLPDPEQVLPFEPQQISVEKWPTLFVEVHDTLGKTGTTQQSSGAEIDLFSYRYRCRLYAWCRANDALVDGGAVEQQVRRMLLAIRESLLIKKVLIDDETYGQTARVDPNTVKETYGQPGTDKAGLIISGAFVEVEILTYESLEAWPPPSDLPTTVAAPLIQAVGLGDTLPIPPTAP